MGSGRGRRVGGYALSLLGALVAVGVGGACLLATRLGSPDPAELPVDRAQDVGSPRSRLVNSESATFGSEQPAARADSRRDAPAESAVVVSPPPSLPPGPRDAGEVPVEQDRTVESEPEPVVVPADAVDADVALLGSGTAAERFNAAIRLGKTRGVKVSEALRQAAREDEDVFVRRAAVRSLGAMRTREALACVLEKTDEDSEEYVRGQAFKVLMEVSQKDFGYVRDQPGRERASAILRVREWWEEHQLEFSPEENAEQR